MVPMKIFGLNDTRSYAVKVAKHISLDLAKHEEKTFDDGEFYLKSITGLDGNVRGHNVFVIQSLYGDNQSSSADKLMKLLIMCSALKTASACCVVAVLPYLAYARQDRKTVSRAPISTQLIANMLESSGVNHVLFIDVHNLSAVQNAFRMPIDNLETKNLHAKWCAEELKKSGASKIRVLTPDAGGLGRAIRFRNALAKVLGCEFEDDIEMCIFDKVRSKGKVTGGRVIGDVDGADVIAYDDMISTGGTMTKACRTAVDQGGNLFAVCAAHGLFCGKANEVLRDFDTKFVISDTVEPFRLNEENRAKVHTIDTTKMVADAVMKIHSGTGSISELLEIGNL